ncbi:MAG TPA: pyridoxamine 5'-phosphate oxidase family protein [Acidobacteriota bacterium]|nr:pyridoxamine 5'-phosphate oxidase family protein [Acidobacteriota bacterium]
MSRELGTRIPSDLAGRISSPEPAAKAVPLISLDGQGFPHVALLSYFEIFLLREQVYFFIQSASRTARNLERAQKCTLIFAHRDFIYYLKGRVRRVGVRLPQTLYRIETASISEDFPAADESEAVLTSGIRFHSDAEDTRRRLRLRSDMVEFATEEERQKGKKP